MQEPRFPEPEYFGRRRHWRLSSLIAFEQAIAGNDPPAPLPAAEERFLTAAQVRERYGNVSDMWLWRRTTGRERSEMEAA